MEETQTTELQIQEAKPEEKKETPMYARFLKCRKCGIEYGTDYAVDDGFCLACSPAFERGRIVRMIQRQKGESK